MPAEGVKEVAQMMGAAHQHQSPRDSQIDQAAPELILLALLSLVCTSPQAIIQAPDSAREALVPQTVSTPHSGCYSYAEQIGSKCCMTMPCERECFLPHL